MFNLGNFHSNFLPSRTQLPKQNLHFGTKRHESATQLHSNSIPSVDSHTQSVNIDSSSPYKFTKTTEKPEFEAPRSYFKFYKNGENASSSTVASLRVTDNPTQNESAYGNRPHLLIPSINVRPKARQRGLSKELVRLAVEISKKAGYKGRLGLRSMFFSETPAGLIHTKNGFRFINETKAKTAKEAIKDSVELAISGDMYLSKRQIKKYLNREPLSISQDTFTSN